MRYTRSAQNQSVTITGIVGHDPGMPDLLPLRGFGHDHRNDRSRSSGIPSNRSKVSLSDLAFDKMVTVETDKRDRYGREVGKVLVNGRDVNLIQVERGMAWHYKAYEREQSSSDRKLYDAAESDAKAARRGLWRDAEPTPPWEFRKAKRGG